MGFQSVEPKPELVWSKCPQSVCDVNTGVFSTNSFDLMCPYGTKLFAIAHVLFVAQDLKQFAPMSQAAI